MKEGIYTVVFESSQQSVGEGVVVVNNGRVHGLRRNLRAAGKPAQLLCSRDI